MVWMVADDTADHFAHLLDVCVHIHVRVLYRKHAHQLVVHRRTSNAYEVNQVQVNRDIYGSAFQDKHSYPSAPALLGDAADSWFVERSACRDDDPVFDLQRCYHPLLLSIDDSQRICRCGVCHSPFYSPCECLRLPYHCDEGEQESDDGLLVHNRLI